MAQSRQIDSFCHKKDTADKKMQLKADSLSDP